MADNTTLPGTGEVYAADDRGGVKFQRVLVEGEQDSASVDAFGRWRVSNPETVFDSKLLGADDGPLLWDESEESGSGGSFSTPTAAKPYIDLASTNVTATTLTRQTFRRFNYQPGKSQLAMLTGVLELASGVTTGCERRFGLFDDDNGVFFESSAGTVGVTIRSNDTGTPVDTTVAQVSWNLDVMDGGADAENPSGLTVDWTKVQVFVMDYQWPTGRIRMGLEIDGHLWYVHEFSQANSDTTPWSSTPNLPLRVQLITTSSSGVNSMRAISATVMSEGGTRTSIPFSAGTTAHVDAAVADTVYALVGIRLKSTHLGATVKVTEVSGMTELSDSYELQLIHNPTVASTFTYGNLTNSACQFATGATANTVTGGTVIARGYGSLSVATIKLAGSDLLLGAAIDATVDELVLCVRPLNADADIQGCINWEESP